MTDSGFIDVKLRVLQVDERNGRHILKTTLIPESLAPHVDQVEMRRSSDPIPEIYLFYQPFLDMVSAVEGHEVPFRLDTENWKLVFAPAPEFFFGDNSIAITSTQSAVHRLYKPLKRKGEDKLYWCVDLEKDKDGSIKKKAKLILMDVSRYIKSSTSIDDIPHHDSSGRLDLFTTMKPTKLAVALPIRSLFGSLQSRSNSNTSIASSAEGNRTSPRSASSTSESILSDNDNSVVYADSVVSTRGSKSSLSTRLKRNIGAYEDGMFSYGVESSPYI